MIISRDGWAIQRMLCKYNKNPKSPSSAVVEPVVSNRPSTPQMVLPCQYTNKVASKQPNLPYNEFSLFGSMPIRYRLSDLAHNTANYVDRRLASSDYSIGMLCIFRDKASRDVAKEICVTDLNP